MHPINPHLLIIFNSLYVGCFLYLFDVHLHRPEFDSNGFNDFMDRYIQYLNNRI